VVYQRHILMVEVWFAPNVVIDQHRQRNQRRTRVPLLKTRRR
jgi:hypothetical protein